MRISETKLLAFLESDKQSAQKRLQEWATKFEKNPAYALEWSFATFDNAAEFEVTTMVINYITERPIDFTFEKVVEEIVKALRREVLQKARSPDHSTSTPSNLMSLSINSQKVKMLERLENCQCE